MVMCLVLARKHVAASGESMLNSMVCLIARPILDRASEDKNPVLLPLGSTCFKGSKMFKASLETQGVMRKKPVGACLPEGFHVAPSQAKYSDVLGICSEWCLSIRHEKPLEVYRLGVWIHWKFHMSCNS